MSQSAVPLELAPEPCIKYFKSKPPHPGYGSQGSIFETPPAMGEDRFCSALRNSRKYHRFGGNRFGFVNPFLRG